jgi:hypothetical protein
VLGLIAIEAGYRVRFIQVTLVQELPEARQEVQLNVYLKSWRKR